LIAHNATTVVKNLRGFIESLEHIAGPSDSANGNAILVTISSHDLQVTNTTAAD
jgi:hypothetical protein